MTATSVDLNITADVDVPGAISVDAISGLIAFILDHEGASGAWSIGIQFISDAEIQRMHRDFMGIDAATDIMTFPYGNSDDGCPSVIENEVGGDLVISVDHARDNAVSAGWSTAEELLFLIAHGILHLTGWNDHREAERKAMLARQQDLMEWWHAKGQLGSPRSPGP